MPEHQISRLAEAAEAEFMYHYETMGSASTQAALGIAAARIGGGVALSMRNDVTGYWSKALGFGFTEPITDRLVDQVIDFYRVERSPSAVIQIAPESGVPLRRRLFAAEEMMTESLGRQGHGVDG